MTHRGSGFDTRDLWAYLVGVIVAAAVEKLIRARTVPLPTHRVKRDVRRHAK